MKKVIGNNKKWFLGLIACLIVAILFPQIVRVRFVWNLLSLIMVWAVVGMGWNVIGGYCGQVSNGHSLFYGIGAYTVAITCQYWKISPWISIWLGAVISMVVAFIFGKPLLRLKGHVFAISTMALAECARIIFVNWKWVGGATGVYIYTKGVNEYLYMQFKNPLNYYYVFLIFVVAILVMIKILDKSKFFYYLRTIKGNEMAAESVGIDVAKYKNRAYIMSAAIVSIGGSLYAQFLLYIDPATIMTLNISMMIVLTAVMGGVGTVEGPILGAIVLTTISEYSRVYLGQYGGLDLILYGVLVILIVLFIPGGILSIFNKWFEKREAAKTKGEVAGGNV
ncbi:MAG: branched-chain amino acid ABC transporter permease [Lachnospiraceae bacterium]|nr:branched-chain amino acid ABC transporter permease [Clostridiaceae bacterium]MDY3827014.1 branched-chain amino acid ABC transporter permease [Lachnospiraceae bacterium]